MNGCPRGRPAVEKKPQKSPRVEREREVVEMNMHNKWTVKAPETVEVRTSVSCGEKDLKYTPARQERQVKERI